MEGFNFSALNDALGIHRPWLIKSVGADNRKSQIVVNLEASKKNKNLSFFDSKKNNPKLIEGSWAYQPIGSFRSIIQAYTSPLQSNTAINDTLLSLPAFVGHPARKYSNYLRQQVALSQLKGLDNSTIASTLFIDEALVEQIIKDINLSPSKARALVCLPTEVDPIWNKVLSNRVFIRTSVLPLKLLLSKSELAIRSGKGVDFFEIIMQLRNFFIANIHLMDDEIDQLCGFNSENMKSRLRQRKSKQRLVLPSLMNPLWFNVLSGNLELKSPHVPLNFLISRQQEAFLKSNTLDEKIQAIDTLRKYFRKHYRSLKSELLFINRVLEIPGQSQWRLPAADHEVWNKILQDKNFIPSNHVAYRMLLATLRSRVSLSSDPRVKVQAVLRIRDFLCQNKNAMRNEINNILLQFSKAV